MNPLTGYDEEVRVLTGVIPLTMGTRLEALLCGVSREEGIALWDGICRRAEALDRCLDRFSPDSELSRLERGELEEPSADLLAVMRESQRWKALTGGLFDAAYGGFRDFGGIAKGYFLEEVGTMLQGITAAYVNFGTSSILTIGSHPSGGPWLVSLPDPVSGEELDSFSLQDCSLSISGNTPFYNGHIIDPRTSKPVIGHVLASVQGPSPLACEVLSTAAMVASPEELPDLRGRFPDYTVRTMRR